jgi:hypothetical protein
LVLDYNVTSSFQGLIASSLPLFSSSSTIDHLTSLNHDDVVIDHDPFLTPKSNLPIVQPKLEVKKLNYNAIRKFQDSWATKFPSVLLCLGSHGNLHTIKCKVCSEVDGKDNLLPVKWDSFCTHVGRKKVEKNIKTNVKKKVWYYSKYFKHAKNLNLLASCSRESIDA